MPRIVIVEDEQIIAADLRYQLERLGYEVVAMPIDAEEAIRAAEELKPDLVLMDVQLQGEMAGIDAARQIQENLGTPIIFLTAFADLLLQEQEKLSRPVLFLSKPFSNFQLQGALGSALGRGGGHSRFGKPGEIRHG